MGLIKSTHACAHAGSGGEGGVFAPQLTSYDYDAPLSEAGATGQPGIGGPNKFQVSYFCCGAYLQMSFLWRSAYLMSTPCTLQDSHMCHRLTGSKPHA